MKLKGFMYRTHALLAIVLMELCMLIPIEFLQKTFWTLKDNILLLCVSVIILVGGSLLPDLDNSVSAAQNRLGILGSIFTAFMQSTSAIIWNVYHFKGDRKPQTQHRYLWHTPIIAIGLILLFYFQLPSGNYTIFTNIKNSIETGQLNYFIQTNAVLMIFIILAFVATLVGSSVVLDRLGKLISIPKFVKYIFPGLVLAHIFTANYSQLRLLGICLGSGYLFHIIADFFADSGVPLIWPIPCFWKNQVWGRLKCPLTVKTGSLANTIIDFIAGVAMIILFIILVSR